MKIQKTLARKIIYPIAMKMGLDKFIRNRSKNSILNVTYHGVVNADSCYFSPRHITREQFEDHLKYYKNNFEVISTSEAIIKLSSREPLRKKYITISFDDGFKNNLTTALPLLEKYNIPATFFISSICVDDEEANYIWAEIILTFNHFYKNESLEVNTMVFKNLFCTEKNIYLFDYIKSLSFERRTSLLERLINKYDLLNKMASLPEEIWKLLNKEEVITLSKSNIVTIGSHGHHHLNLAEIAPESALDELRISKELLTQAISKEVNLVAYPDGNYDLDIKNTAEKLGYTTQFAVNYRHSEDHSDSRIMNRHSISSTTTFESNMLLLNFAFQKKGTSKI